MGNRRMFSKDIVRSDAFLDLPVSSRELYFQLGMETDDRGYISNARSVIRLIGANIGDLEPLVNKGFLLVRGESLMVQKHFGINNIVRSDRFHETEYVEDLKKLFIKENGTYTTDSNQGKPIEIKGGCQLVYQTDTEDKLSKVKLSKDNISKVNLFSKEKGVNESNKGERITHDQVSKILEIKQKKENNISLTDEENELLEDFELF